MVWDDLTFPLRTPTHEGLRREGRSRRAGVRPSQGHATRRKDGGEEKGEQDDAGCKECEWGRQRKRTRETGREAIGEKERSVAVVAAGFHTRPAGPTHNTDTR